jgi:soluble lytic murein transglycosylase-like protein
MSAPPWMKNFPLEAITAAAKSHQLDTHLVMAIVATESAGKTYAFRYEPHFRWLLDVEKYAKMNQISRESEEMAQKISWGLMQVMGAVAREMGFKGLLPELCHPEVGLRYGCQKFSLCLRGNEFDLPTALAAYNAGSPRRKENGEWVNQTYVDKVLQKMQQLKDR